MSTNIENMNEAVRNKIRGVLSGHYAGKGLSAANDLRRVPNPDSGGIQGARGLARPSSATMRTYHRMRAAERDERQLRKQAGLGRIGGIKRYGEDMQAAAAHTASGASRYLNRVAPQPSFIPNPTPQAPVSYPSSQPSVSSSGKLPSSDPNSDSYMPPVNTGKLGAVTGPADQEYGGGDQDYFNYGSLPDDEQSAYYNEQDKYKRLGSQHKPLPNGQWQADEQSQYYQDIENQKILDDGAERMKKAFGLNQELNPFGAIASAGASNYGLGGGVVPSHMSAPNFGMGGSNIYDFNNVNYSNGVPTTPAGTVASGIPTVNTAPSFVPPSVASSKMYSSPPVPPPVEATEDAIMKEDFSTPQEKSYRKGVVSANDAASIAGLEAQNKEFDSMNRPSLIDRVMGMFDKPEKESDTAKVTKTKSETTSKTTPEKVKRDPMGPLSEAEKVKLRKETKARMDASVGKKKSGGSPEDNRTKAYKKQGAGAGTGYSKKAPAKAGRVERATAKARAKAEAYDNEMDIINTILDVKGQDSDLGSDLMSEHLKMKKDSANAKSKAQFKSQVDKLKKKGFKSKSRNSK